MCVFVLMRLSHHARLFNASSAKVGLCRLSNQQNERKERESLWVLKETEYQHRENFENLNLSVVCHYILRLFLVEIIRIKASNGSC